MRVEDTIRARSPCTERMSKSVDEDGDEKEGKGFIFFQLGNYCVRKLREFKDCLPEVMNMIRKLLEG
jgi:hypothetical protein